VITDQGQDVQHHFFASDAKTVQIEVKLEVAARLTIAEIAQGHDCWAAEAVSFRVSAASAANIVQINYLKLEVAARVTIAKIAQGHDCQAEAVSLRVSASSDADTVQIEVKL
jgi:hypothetical protein